MEQSNLENFLENLNKLNQSGVILTATQAFQLRQAKEVLDVLVEQVEMSAASVVFFDGEAFHVEQTIQAGQSQEVIIDGDEIRLEAGLRLGAYLQRARESLGLSCEALAKETQDPPISDEIFKAIEHGHVHPATDVLQEMIRVLDEAGADIDLNFANDLLFRDRNSPMLESTY